MLVIGLTGGMGTGKSEVSSLLREMGAAIIDADQIGHQAYLKDTETLRKVVASFGQEMLQPSGEIDRKKLGDRVFYDTQALANLNSIMHPRIFQIIRERIETHEVKAAEITMTIGSFECPSLIPILKLV